MQLTFGSHWASKVLGGFFAAVSALVAGAGLLGLFGGIADVDPVVALILAMVGGGLAVVGLLIALSVAVVVFDLGGGTYRIRRGVWPFVKSAEGALSELERVEVRYEVVRSDKSTVEYWPVYLRWRDDSYRLCLRRFTRSRKGDSHQLAMAYAADISRDLRVPSHDASQSHVLDGVSSGDPGRPTSPHLHAANMGAEAVLTIAPREAPASTNGLSALMILVGVAVGAAISYESSSPVALVIALAVVLTVVAFFRRHVSDTIAAEQTLTVGHGRIVVQKGRRSVSLSLADSLSTRIESTQGQAALSIVRGNRTESIGSGLPEEDLAWIARWLDHAAAATQETPFARAEETSDVEHLRQYR
jgi:hypothetical protein